MDTVHGKHALSGQSPTDVLTRFEEIICRLTSDLNRKPTFSSSLVYSVTNIKRGTCLNRNSLARFVLCPNSFVHADHENTKNSASSLDPHSQRLMG